MLGEIKEIMQTEKTEEYNILLNKRLAAELTKNSFKGIQILSKDDNPVPYQEINKNIENNPNLKVHFENDDTEKIIRANLLTPENQREFFIDMTTHTDSSLNIISKKTYDTLVNEVVIEPINTLAEVKNKLEDAI